MSPQNDFSDRVAAYTEELRRYYRRTHLPTSAETSEAADAEPAFEDNLPDITASVIPESEEPAPPILIEPPQERPWEEESMPHDDPMPVSDEEGAPQTDVGYLRVRASSARGAIPLEGVTVTIRRGNEVLHITQTDQSGFTPIFPLPTVSRDISMHPSDTLPSVSYNVQADFPGYYSSLNERIPVYGGVTSVQEIAMIPLPEAGGQSEPIVNPGQIGTELN